MMGFRLCVKDLDFGHCDHVVRDRLTDANTKVFASFVLSTVCTRDPPPDGQCAVLPKWRSISELPNHATLCLHFLSNPVS